MFSVSGLFILPNLPDKLYRVSVTYNHVAEFQEENHDYIFSYITLLNAVLSLYWDLKQEQFLAIYAYGISTEY